MGHVEAASRTVERLEDVYKRTNLSPLGVAAFAGTGWPVNRLRTMKLLGCDGLVENTHDGVASMDYYMEFVSAIAIHLSNLSRLSEDIQVWSSDEFKFIELDEAYAGTSSIMPQKKNPIILEQTRSYASESIGAVTTIFTSMKGMPYTNTSDARARRNGIGMPAPESVNAMIKTQKARVIEEEKRLKSRLERLDHAKNILIEAENKL